MSVARALTKRIRRDTDPQDPPTMPSLRPKKSVSAINRKLISGPVELLSTTNMLSYNAPDISKPVLKKATSTNTMFKPHADVIPEMPSHANFKTANSSSTTSLKSKGSADEFDALGLGPSPELTDSSSIDSDSPISPKLNHLSTYFAAANPKAMPMNPMPNRAISTTSLRKAAAASPPLPAPVPAPIPQRALSHSKEAHEKIARKNSLRNSQSSRESSQPAQPSRSRASSQSKRATEELPHPFGKELQQLKEAVEEFGGVKILAEMDDDLIFMRDNNLAKFSAIDYLHEIQPLFNMAFEIGAHAHLAAAQEVSWI